MRKRIGEKEDKAETRRQLRAAMRIGAVGLEMGIAVAVGYLGGNYLDGHFGTTPYLGLMGLLLGVGAAGKALWSTARKMEKDES